MSNEIPKATFLQIVGRWGQPCLEIQPDFPKNTGSSPNAIPAGRGMAFADVLNMAILDPKTSGSESVPSCDTKKILVEIEERVVR